MRNVLNLLILLTIIISAPLWAEETTKPNPKTPPSLETPSAYQKLTAEELEWLLKVKGHINSLQVFPLLNQDHFQFDLGPGHFQFTFPFR